MNRTIKSAVFLLATIFMTSSHAAGVATKGFSVSPFVGWHYFSNEENLDDDWLYGLGLGYNFNNNWGIEGSYYGVDDTDVEHSDLDADAESYGLDILYHFHGERDWTPYVSFGMSEFEVDAQGAPSYDQTMVNLGLGAKKILADRLLLRGEVRGQESLDEEHTNAIVTVGLSYLFGKEGPIDSDGDGVYDDTDQCPNTPRGEAVDAVGCSYPKTQPCPTGTMKKGDKCVPLTIRLHINFDFDSTKIQQKYHTDIARVADYLKAFPQTTVILEGHTDSVGDAVYNQKLSEARAQSVKNYLTDVFGIEKVRVTAVGYGESKPAADNKTEAGRAENRRVDAEFKSN